MRIYTNCLIAELSPPRVEEGLDLAVEGDRIVGVAPGLHRGGAEVVDLSGGLLMPGLVCSHTHFYSALARGILARIAPMHDFVTRLENLWWRLDRAIDEDILASSAAIGALEAVSSGTTAVIDHHASPELIDGSLDVIAGKMRETGLRGILCYETTDRNGPGGARAGEAENERFAVSGTDELIEAAVGAHAPFTLSDETLERLGGTVRSTRKGFHVHVAEDLYDVSRSHHLHRRDVVARLDSFGLIDERSIVAHGVHLREDELGLLAERRAFLVHNARSNMNNGVGYNPATFGLSDVALGSDGISGDMFEEARTGYFKARDAGVDADPAEIARRLHQGNEILSRAFGRTFGKIEPGGTADLIVLDYDSPTPLRAENLAGHLLFGFSTRHLRRVIVGGTPVWGEDAPERDLAGLHARAREQAERLWRRMDALD